MLIELQVACLLLACVALGVVGDELAHMIIRWKRGK